MSGSAVATAIASAWYNRAPGKNVPFMGIKREVSIDDPDFQKFITAANKRMIKTWMGELKQNLAETPEDQRQYTEEQLNAWFGTAQGKEHFRQWSQQLGKQIGNRNPKQGKPKSSAHHFGNAMDINYEMNPWCPLYSQKYTKMVGENLTSDKNACGRVYDRALRMFVPLVTDETEDPHGINHFAHRYYRNHADWTMTDSTTDTPPYSARQVYTFYQMTNWSIRFYFHYLYGRIAEKRPDDKFNRDLNGYGNHSDTAVASDDEFKASIIKDLKEVCLPPTSEIFIEEDNVPDDAKSHFDELSVKYPFHGSNRTVYRFKINTQEIYDSEEIPAAVITAMKKQIRDDHRALAKGMCYSSESDTRDPCNGFFNFSYETFLALTYLAQDSSWVRAFGAFSANTSGDMQHFDYAKYQRNY